MEPPIAAPSATYLVVGRRCCSRRPTRTKKGAGARGKRTFSPSVPVAIRATVNARHPTASR